MCCAAWKFDGHRLADPLDLIRARPIGEWDSGAPELAPPSPISGRHAYDLYVRHTIPLLNATGGSLDFYGTGGHYFVGPSDERWDLVTLVRQASVDDFLAFASNETYLAGIGHRTAALADSRLLPIAERAFP